MSTHPITAFRKSRSPEMSQDELAKLLGVSREAIWRWEMGKRFPDRKLWPRIAEVTGITPAELAEAAMRAA